MTPQSIESSRLPSSRCEDTGYVANCVLSSISLSVACSGAVSCRSVPSVQTRSSCWPCVTKWLYSAGRSGVPSTGWPIVRCCPRSAACYRVRAEFASAQRRPPCWPGTAGSWPNAGPTHTAHQVVHPSTTRRPHSSCAWQRRTRDGAKDASEVNCASSEYALQPAPLPGS